MGSRRGRRRRNASGVRLAFGANRPAVGAWLASPASGSGVLGACPEASLTMRAASVLRSSRTFGCLRDFAILRRYYRTDRTTRSSHRPGRFKLIHYRLSQSSLPSRMYLGSGFPEWRFAFGSELRSRIPRCRNKRRLPFRLGRALLSAQRAE
jgi:hypothetical protein